MEYEYDLAEKYRGFNVIRAVSKDGSDRYFIIKDDNDTFKDKRFKYMTDCAEAIDEYWIE